jgi:hypothetical protein
MSEPGQQLPFRLQRQGSKWMVVLQRLVFTGVWNVIFVVFLLLAWRNRATTPPFMLGVLGLFVLFGLGMAWDLIARISRVVTAKTAVVEVDRQPVRPGETLKLRVFQKDPESLEALRISLIGENTVTETDGGTTITRTGRCFEKDVHRYEGSDLTGASLDGTFSVRMPTKTPPGTTIWSILVSQQLAQGGVDPQTFPLQVES